MHRAIRFIIKQASCWLTAIAISNIGEIFIFEQQIWVSILLLVMCSLIYNLDKLSYWSRVNIKGPRPMPILGNLCSYIRNSREQLDLLWVKTYGRTFGLYFGTLPILVTADADVASELFVKNSHIFKNRCLLFGARNKYQRHLMIFLEDQRHEKLRTLIVPTFNKDKIRMMHRRLDEHAKETAGQIEQQMELSSKSRNSISITNTKAIFTAYSMATGVRCFVSIKLEAEKPGETYDDRADTKENFTRKVEIAFKPRPLRMLIAALFPTNLLQRMDFYTTPVGPFRFFVEKAKAIIRERRRKASGNRDYLDILLTKTGDDLNKCDTAYDIEMHHAPSVNDFNPAWRLSKLTEDEILCNTSMMMLGTSITTSVLITNVIFILSQELEIQEQVYKELANIVHQNEDDYFEAIISSPYLDCVISETLRCYGLVVYVDRFASEDFKLDSHDLMIRADTVVQTAIWAIHHDEEYWPEPFKFNPDRFLPENRRTIVPGSYCPFGFGSRCCPSFRFALAQAKLCVANILAKFRLLPADGAKYPPDMRTKFFLTEIANPAVRFKKR